MKAGSLMVREDVVLITAVVQRGLGDGVVEAAVGAGANGGTVCYGSGVGNRERLGVLALALDVDQEIVYVLVPRELETAVFTTMAEAEGMGRPGRGMLFTTPVERLAAYGHSAAAEKDEP